MSTEITDPEVLAFIARTESHHPPDAIDRTIADQRRVYDALCDDFREPRPKDITVTDETVGAVPQRRYAPHEAGPVTVVYYHGGGFVVGGLDSHDDICAEIAAGACCTLVSVDYRLCPEHLHPAAYEDALAAARTALEAGPVILAGDSAGGNLAAAVAQTLRREDIRGQVLIYPGLGGDTIGLESYVECAEAPLLTTRDIDFYREVRAGGPPPRNDPTFFPLLADNFDGLAPCFVTVADADPLRDDGVEYVRLLIGAGVTAYCAVEPQLPHGFLRARHMSHRAAEAFGRIVDAVKEFAGDS